MVKKSALVFILAIFAMVIISFKLGPTSGLALNDKEKKEEIQWLSFDKGLELAKKQKKMLVVDIYTDWCHWCKVMEKDTYGNKRVIDFAKSNAVMAKLNAESTEKFKFKDAFYTGRELSMMLGVEGFPTTAFMTSDGELITKISGFIPPDKFNMIMKYLAGNWYEKMEFNEFVKKQEAKNKS